MGKLLVGVLSLANLAMLGAVLWTFSPSGDAQEQRIRVSDLTYGAVDIDGDGQYTYGDDLWVSLAVERWPHALEQALESAKVNDDGGVDLSAYLLTVTDQTVEAPARDE